MSSQQQLYLAVFLGSKDSPRMQAWIAQPEQARREKDDRRRGGGRASRRRCVAVRGGRLFARFRTERSVTMKLYGFAGTRTQRALWGLKELGVDFEFVPVNLLEGEHRRPDFLRINPAGKVPVLIDGDLVIPESAAIVLYLADKYPDKHLLPVDLAQRAHAYRWIMFAVTELEQPLWRIARHTMLYPPDKRLPADIALARDDFASMAVILERHLDGRAFIVGDTLRWPIA